MRVRVWRYDVAPDVRAQFVQEYGPAGSWARLFAVSPSFVDTALYADVARAGSFLTVDRFVDEAGWAEFRAKHDAAYSELGLGLKHLTIAQEELV